MPEPSGSRASMTATCGCSSGIWIAASAIVRLEEGADAATHDVVVVEEEDS
jgi:hypothetical protein